MQLHSQLALYSGPSVEPITLDEAKLHLRQDVDDDDDLIASLVVAARRVCEARTRRAFLDQTWDYRLDAFPWPWVFHPDRAAARVDYEIRLPIATATSVTSITWIGWDGSTSTLDPAGYVFAPGEPGRIVPRPYDIWPWPQVRPAAISIRFVAGYGASASAVPDTIKAAMKLLIGHWYENREVANIGNISTDLPWAVDALLSAEEWSLVA